MTIQVNSFQPNVPATRMPATDSAEPIRTHTFSELKEPAIRPLAGGGSRWLMPVAGVTAAGARRAW